MHVLSEPTRPEGVIDVFGKRFPNYQFTASDWSYLLKLARETEIDTAEFAEWLGEHQGVDAALAEGGAFLVVECFDDRHPIWKFPV